ncbi:hypothetical protein KI387_022544, partial [Taxus chinensis]
MYVIGTNIVPSAVDTTKCTNQILCGSHSNIFDKVGIGISLNRKHPKLRHALNFSLMRPIYSQRHGLRVITVGISKGNYHGPSAVSEHSESANEDILLFFFQLDLTTRIQCALNLDQYEIAQQLRNKLTEVEQELTRQRESKTGSVLSKDEAQDKAITILHLRTDLQKAIESEDYVYAAKLRDQISNLEADSLAAAARAMAYQNAKYKFRLGQKVRHAIFGYRAVICGMDPLCCESSSWIEHAHIDQLSRGRNQPFYLVLVDVHADPTLLVAYVAEEKLSELDKLDLDRFDHPYVSFLFYGMDSAGDFIPIKKLREKYNRPRHEVHREDNNDDDFDDDK